MITAKYIRGTASQLIHTGSCKVTGFYVSSDAVASEVILMDGVDVGGAGVRRACPAANDEKEYRFAVPVEFETGIYIYVVTAPYIWVVEFII